MKKLIRRLVCIALSAVVLTSSIQSTYTEAYYIGKVDVSKVKVPKSKKARFKKAAKLCWTSYKKYLKERKLLIEYLKKGKQMKYTTIDFDLNVLFKLDQELYAYIIGTENSILSKKEIKKFWKKLDSVMSGLNLKGKSDYEKVKAIQDWITKNVAYDDGYYNYDCNASSYGAYGALMNGKAVCDGYARLATLMFMKAGLPVLYCSGDNHAFNIVKVDGKWYYIDTCWGAAGWGTRWFLKNEYDFTHNDDGSIKDSHIIENPDLDELGIKIAKNSYPIPEADQPKNNSTAVAENNSTVVSKNRNTITIADVPSDKYQEFSQEYYSYPALANFGYNLENYILRRYKGSIGLGGLTRVPDWIKRTSTPEPTPVPTPEPVATPEPVPTATSEPVATSEPIPILTSNDFNVAFE